jgi:Fe-S oxidoreductase
MIENVIQTTENCRYCLMCRHVCPVGHVTRKETLTPHGWGLTIASQRRGMLEWDEETVDVLYSCADCGTCRANCVTDQPLPSAIAATRAEIAGMNLAPAVIYEIHEKLEKWGNPHDNSNGQKTIERGQIALFVGDDAYYLGRDGVEAALKLLAAAGVEPVLIGVGRNNGYLASSLGFPDTATSLAQATYGELRASGASRMLVLTPGDYYAFGQMHEERLGLSCPEGVELLEVVPFLAERVATGELGFRRSNNGTPYAYIDPTHSVRVPGRFDAPRELLSAVMPGPGRELFWRRERAHPCGNGALQYTQPHIANHLTYARLGDARERGAQLLITEDPGNLAHLRQHAPRFGLQIQGLYELLADQIV